MSVYRVPGPRPGHIDTIEQGNARRAWQRIADMDREKWRNRRALETNTETAEGR